jgi:hypothetical protein
MSSHAQTPFLPDWVETENVSILPRGSLNIWAVTRSLAAGLIRYAMLSESTLQPELRDRILKERRLPYTRATGLSLKPMNAIGRTRLASQVPFFR